MRNKEIKNTYYDALNFASATFNEKEGFAITPAQLKVMYKLIHYSKDNEVITWQSKQIAKHICTPEISVNKSIQRLKQKGYISVITKQMSGTAKTRSIKINWTLIEQMDKMYQEWLTNDSIIEVEPKVVIEEKIQPIKEKRVNSIEKQLIKLIQDKHTANNAESLIKKVEAGEITSIEELDEMTKDYIY